MWRAVDAIMCMAVPPKGLYVSPKHDFRVPDADVSLSPGVHAACAFLHSRHLMSHLDAFMSTIVMSASWGISSASHTRASRAGCFERAHVSETCCCLTGPNTRLRAFLALALLTMGAYWFIFAFLCKRCHACLASLLARCFRPPSFLTVDLSSSYYR